MEIFQPQQKGPVRFLHPLSGVHREPTERSDEEGVTVKEVDFQGHEFYPDHADWVDFLESHQRPEANKPQF